MLAVDFKFKVLQQNGLSLSVDDFGDYRISITPVENNVTTDVRIIANANRHGTCTSNTFARERKLKFKGNVCGDNPEMTQCGRDQLCRCLSLPANPQCGEFFVLEWKDWKGNRRRQYAKVNSDLKCQRINPGCCVIDWEVELLIENHWFFGDCKKINCETTYPICGSPLYDPEEGDCKDIINEKYDYNFCQRKEKGYECKSLIEEECITDVCKIVYGGKYDANVRISVLGPTNNFTAQNLTNGTGFKVDGDLDIGIISDNSGGSFDLESNGNNIFHKLARGTGITLSEGVNNIVLTSNSEPVPVCIEFYETFTG